MKPEKLIVPILLAGILCACGEDRKKTSAQGGLEEVDPSGQEVVFWHQYRGDREKIMNTLIDKFNSSNSHSIVVKGEYIGNYNAIYNKMLTGLQGGYLPQLVPAYNYQAEAYYNAGGVVDLNPYMNSPKWGLGAEELADYNQAFLQQDDIRGIQVGLLPSRSMEILYYNQAWIQELGYEGPPKNWDEFARMCRQAAKQPFSGSVDPSHSIGISLKVDASRLAAMVFSRGGDFVSADGSVYTLNTPQARASLELLRDLQSEGVLELLSEEKKSGFGGGQVLFEIRSSSRLSFFINSIESGAGFAWNVAPLPYEGKQPVQNVYGGSLSVCKSTPAQQLAAWLFIKWFTQPLQQEHWVRGSNYFPVRKSTARALEQSYRTAYDLLEYGKPEPAKVGYEFIRGMIEKAMVEAVKGGDIEQILSQLEAEANKPL